MNEWRCPSCSSMAGVTAEIAQQAIFALPVSPNAGPTALRVLAIACPNKLCGQLNVTATLHRLEDDGAGNMIPVEPPVRDWNMMPGPGAKELPPYVPEAAAREFSQAVQVLPVSPTASATLARRCLQILVRDFFDVKGKVLAEELDMIRDRVDTETWEAIEAVRMAGNIELHLEKGVSVMADTDSEEPTLLIDLIEYLVENWYVARRRRQQRLEKIKNAAPADAGPRMSRRPPSSPMSRQSSAGRAPERAPSTPFGEPEPPASPPATPPQPPAGRPTSAGGPPPIPGKPPKPPEW